MKVVLDTQVLEDAELRAITKYRTAGKSKRKATRAEAKQFLQQVLDEAVAVALAGPPPMIPTAGSAGPGPDAEFVEHVDVSVGGGSESEVFAKLDQLKAYISKGEEVLSAEDIMARGPEVLKQFTGEEK